MKNNVSTAEELLDIILECQPDKPIGRVIALAYIELFINSLKVYYEVVPKDEWFEMGTDEREQLVAGRDLKTGEPIWLRKL